MKSTAYRVAVMSVILALLSVGWTWREQNTATTWEYKVVNIIISHSSDSSDYEAQLNQLGSQGWELVLEQPGAEVHDIRYILKRPKKLSEKFK